MFSINNLIAFSSVLYDLLFSLFPDLLIPTNYRLTVFHCGRNNLPLKA